MKRHWAGGVPLEVILIGLTALFCLAAVSLRLAG